MRTVIKDNGAPLRLAGILEAAELYGVNKSFMRRLLARDGAPEPVADLAAGPVYDRDDLERHAREWKATKKVGRPRASATLCAHVQQIAQKALAEHFGSVDLTGTVHVYADPGRKRAAILRVNSTDAARVSAAALHDHGYLWEFLPPQPDDHGIRLRVLSTAH